MEHPFQEHLDTLICQIVLKEEMYSDFCKLHSIENLYLQLVDQLPPEQTTKLFGTAFTIRRISQGGALTLGGQIQLTLIG